MTTFTREDFEHAARSIGWRLVAFDGVTPVVQVHDGARAFGWRPHADDGDALRLAVALRLQVTPGTYNSEEVTAYRSGHAESHERVHFQQDIGAATRHAIFRAAIAIGRAMP